MRKVRKHLFALIVPMLVCLVLCAINLMVVKQDVYGIPFVTSKKVSNNNIIDYTGFGVKVSVLDQKGQDDIVKEDKDIYNETAGTLSTWNNVMSLDQYNKYKDDLVSVNGSIINSETHDNFIEYSFDNGEVLRVDFKETGEKLELYSHDFSGVALVEKIGDENSVDEISKYENGVVVKIKRQITKGVEPLKIKMNYEFDIENLLIHYVVIVGIYYIIMLLYESLAIRHGETAESVEAKIEAREMEDI